MPALRAHEWRTATPWLPSMDVHEQEGYLVVTVEPGLLGTAEDDPENGITTRGWELLDHLGLPFRPDTSRTATRLVHGSLEVRIPLPEEDDDAAEALVKA